MNEVSLKKAVGDIYKTVSLRKRRGLDSPFFFIVGAGISYPPVPLAVGIEQRCREEAGNFGDSSEFKSDDPMETYSHWFTQGYPTPDLRQRYLQELMEPMKIPGANLLLANLVVDGTLARTIFTPNFDDLLSKALNLFRHRHLVCDHPLTASRMSVEAKDTQIIHVHGSYWFYDCCNLKSEIMDRTDNSAPMAQTLSEFLSAHSPIVVGYSGWHSDILMTSLNRRLEGRRLGTQLYWFCYRRDEVSKLPDWLRNHADVVFVVPEDTPQAAPEDAPPVQSSRNIENPQAAPPQLESLKISERKKMGELPADRVSASVLPADRVFQALITQFAVKDPPLLINPIDPLINQLGETDVSPDDAYSVKYDFKKLTRRLQKVRSLYLEAEQAQGDGALQGLRMTMERGDYRAAIQSARMIDFSALTSADRREALYRLGEAARGLYDNTPEELEGYEYVVELGYLLSEQDQADPGTRKQISDAMFCWAMTLEVLSRRQEAVAIYDKLVQRFARAQELEIRQQVAKAMFNKGAILNAMDRIEESLRPYEELQKQFDHETDPVIIENIAKAMFNKGWSLVALKRYSEGVAAYTELIERFTAATEPALREQVAKSLLNRGMARSSLGESVEEMADYDELVHRFKDSPEPALRERVAKGLLYKGATLASLKDPQGAIDVYDDVIRRFGDADELVLREQVAKALLSKGYTLGTLGTLENSEKEMEVYAELLRRFDAAPEPSLQEQVAKAIFNRGATMVEMQRPEEGIPIYASLVERFGDSPERAIREQVAKALLSAARLHENAGRIEEAATLCQATISRFDNPNDQSLNDYVDRARAKLRDLAKAANPAPAHANGTLAATP